MLRIICALVLLTLSSYSYSAVHYIRSGATGSANGNDWTNAYTDIPASPVRGDTYYIAGGTYPSHTFNRAASGTLTITFKKATEADHGAAADWNATYGTTQAAWTGGWTITTPYWVFDGVTGGGFLNGWSGGFGFKITETASDTPMIGIGTPGGSHQADNITMAHIEFVGMGSESPDGGSFSNDGLAVYTNSNVTLSYYHMHGIGRCPFFMSVGGFIAEHGWVESFFAGATTHGEIMSSWDTVGDISFRYNLFTDIQSTGGLMWDNAANTSAVFRVYGNIFYKPSGATWDVANGVVGGWTGDSGCTREQYKNANIYNNSFVGIDQDSLSALQLCYANNTASNNLWYNSDSPIFTVYATHDYNHFINSGGSHSEAHGTSATSGDPFTNAAAFDFTLTAATTAGLTLSSPYTIDPAGLTRGADGVWDRGAFDYDGGSINITGTLSKTEGADTATTSGEPSIAGTFSKTEGADTATTSGGPSIAGTFSKTEGADTSSATGGPVVSGTFSKTEGADTVTGSGSTSISGSLSKTEAADSGAGIGSTSITGALSKTEGADLGAGTGTVTGGVAGTLSATEGADTATGAGSSTITGTGGGVEGVDTVTGSGSTSITGAGGGTEGADTAAGAGSVVEGISGNLAKAEGADILAGSGSTSVAGTGGGTEGADTAAGVGTVTAPSTIPTPTRLYAY